MPLVLTHHVLTAVLNEYGLAKLPPMPPKGGLYKRTLIVGDLVYVSGHGPLLESGHFNCVLYACAV